MPEVTGADVDRMTSSLFIEPGLRSPGFTKFWTLLILAALIAAAGVVGDSTATVIGAMIVAPLMTPILGSALAFVLVDRRHLIRSVMLVTTGAAAVVAIGYLVGWVGAPPDDFATNSQVNVGGNLDASAARIIGGDDNSRVTKKSGGATAGLVAALGSLLKTKAGAATIAAVVAVSTVTTALVLPGSGKTSASALNIGRDHSPAVAGSELRHLDVPGPSCTYGQSRQAPASNVDDVLVDFQTGKISHTTGSDAAGTVALLQNIGQLGYVRCQNPRIGWGLSVRSIGEVQSVPATGPACRSAALTGQSPQGSFFETSQLVGHHYCIVNDPAGVLYVSFDGVGPPVTDTGQLTLRQPSLTISYRLYTDVPQPAVSPSTTSADPVISPSTAGTGSMHGVVVLTCAKTMSLTGYDPASGQPGATWQFTSTADESSACFSHATSVREQFNADFTKAAGTSVGSDGGKHIGVESVGGMFVDLTPPKATNYGALTPNQSHPAFNPVTGRLWFYDANTPSHLSSVDPDGGPGSQRQESPPEAAGGYFAEGFSFAADGRVIAGNRTENPYGFSLSSDSAGEWKLVASSGATTILTLKSAAPAQDCGDDSYIDANRFLCTGNGTLYSADGIYLMTIDRDKKTITQTPLLPPSQNAVKALQPSPDGQQVAFIAGTTLYVASTSGLNEPRVLAQLDDLGPIYYSTLAGWAP